MTQLHRLFGILVFVVSSFGWCVSAQSALPPLKVVQLGDSYSAGNGARSASGWRNYQGISGCYRSPTNWGNQFLDSLRDVFSVTYVNRACSGSVIDDILNPNELDSYSASFGFCPSPEYPEEESYVYDGANNSCIRTLVPQIEGIDESVDLVLMTGGGNDLKFANIIKQCFVAGPRDPAGCKAAIEFAQKELDKNVEDRLTKTFAELRRKLRPDARVVFVTYPYLVPDVGYYVEKWGDFYNAGNAIRALGLAGDAVQREAVAAANAAAGEEFVVLFDGTKELFEGHLPNPLRGKNSNRWLYEAFETGLKYRLEWYHYNPLGHQNLGSALSIFETFGAAGGVFDSKADIDVAFIVDTTGSMGDEIAQVRADLESLVAQLAADTNSFRVAVVSYRDFSERTGDSIDYSARVDQTFTNDLAAIQVAVDSLTADGGGDIPETVFSGIDTAIALPWRPGVTKVALVIGDAPALSPEPISGLTTSQIVADSIAVDPVQVFGIDVGSLDSNGALSDISGGTGGEVVLGTSLLTTKISEILTKATSQPFAWIGQAYSGKIGEPIQFDASGSYDPSGASLTLYEWDFDADGVFEFQSTESSASHTYNEAFNDVVVMRVTGPGGTALASARTVANTQGYALQGDEKPCELDENGFSIFVDEEGQFIRCTADSLPEDDKDGVTVGVEEDDGGSNNGGGHHHSGGCTVSSSPVKSTDRGDLWLLGGMLLLLGALRKRKVT
jgi:Mg-chelatase subunit ChlD